MSATRILMIQCILMEFKYSFTNLKKTHRSKSLNAILLDSFDLSEELHIIDGVGVLDVPAHEQVEVLRRYEHAHEVQDACEVGECNATIVLGHLCKCKSIEV